MADLIVITGGAYSGKTSVINELAARGYESLDESAFSVIDELNEAMEGVENQVEWRKQNLVEFQRRLTRKQFEKERIARKAEARFVFGDRGLLDGRAYCMLAGADWPDDLRDLAADATYAHVFMLETLSNFNPRRETGRLDTLEGSHRTAHLLEDIYAPRTPHITRIPELPVSNRVDLILDTLGLPARNTS